MSKNPNLKQVLAGVAVVPYLPEASLVLNILALNLKQIKKKRKQAHENLKSSFPYNLDEKTEKEYKKLQKENSTPHNPKDPKYFSIIYQSKTAKTAKNFKPKKVDLNLKILPEPQWQTVNGPELMTANDSQLTIDKIVDKTILTIKQALKRKRKKRSEATRSERKREKKKGQPSLLKSPTIRSRDVIILAKARRTCSNR